jgi:hypothetical protein
MRLYDQILLSTSSDYLRGRALIGKAEQLIGVPKEFDNAISLCEKARKILGKDISDFFAAKTYIVESELRLARRAKGDWGQALELINSVVKEKNAHWYFRGRALLSKAEIMLYRDPADLHAALKLADFSIKELKSRPHDYFTNKGKVIKAEILIRRAKAGDYTKAAKLLTEVIEMPFAYNELIGRAKLDMADIVTHPKAVKLIEEVNQMEGLDPYLAEKAALVEKSLEERPQMLALKLGTKGSGTKGKSKPKKKKR